MDIDLASARKFAEDVARSVGPRLREGHGAAAVVAEKSEFPSDIVTLFDTEAEERIAAGLAEFDAGIGFYGEESGRSGSTETFWLVDPIDGTGHFMRGLPFSTTMICLIDGGEPVVSAIYDFVSDQMYSAATGAGATRDGMPISVSNRGLKDAYLAVEMNLSVAGNPELLRRLQLTTPPVNQCNCGWDFTRSAAGQLDGRLMKDAWGHVWDFAPGALLVREAGGVVANLGKTTYDYTDMDFMAVGPQLFEDLTQGPDALFPLE